MGDHERNTRVDRTEAIRSLNDRLRTTGDGGKTFLTQTVAALPWDQLCKLIEGIRQFENFTADNDPYREHDFGSVEIEGKSYFWKIDCYDLNLEFGSPDPADEALTRRVLTIMTASDL